jgi:hypothetical protein
MDILTNVQKRQRVDTVEDCIIVDDGTGIWANPVLEDKSDSSHHGLPSNIEDDSDDSDMDQPDKEPLEESTLWWSDQSILELKGDDEIGLGKPPVEHQMKGILSLLRKTYII